LNRTPLAALVLAVLAALVLAACGEREDPASPAQTPADELDIVLDYLPNADHAGLYTAIENGAFEGVRLDVTPRVPSDPAAPLRLLAARKADLAISYEPEVLLARDKGARVVSIGAIVQVPLTSLMSVGDRAIRSPEQLAGKTVGTAGIPYQDAYLTAILDEAGVDPADVKKVNVGFNLTPAMLNKRVDATLGSFWNVEGVDLERRDRKPTILRIEKLGVPTYNELVIVAREEDARNRGALLRRFMLGLARGHEQLRDDPAAGLDALLAANKGLERDLQEASIEATLPVFFPRDEDQPFGWQDEGQWLAYARWMRDNGLLKRQLDPRGALTNEFLPGEGPQPGDS
jgi:putative hydroxymethylpyrimidine transport system substrate-binding protein